jgi:Predicted membrane protein (DUF2207) N-terminal domain
MNSMQLHGKCTILRLALCLPILLPVLALAWASAIPSAYAADTNTYEHRDYVVYVLANGDIAVTEHWQIFFHNPTYRAYFDIDMGRATGIDFGTVSGSLPGSQVVRKESDSLGNPAMQIYWDFQGAHDETRTFDIPYTIHGALGIGRNQDWLDWHFLDSGFTPQAPTVDSSTVTITLPTPVAKNRLGVVVANSDVAPTTAIPNETTVIVNAQHLRTTNPLEVMVAFPKTVLDANVHRQAWQQTDTPPQPPTSLAIVKSSNETPTPTASKSGQSNDTNTAMVVIIGAAVVVGLGILIAIVNRTPFGVVGRSHSQYKWPEQTDRPPINFP